MTTDQLPGATVPAVTTPVPLMQLATAFWTFKTLAAAVELDVFTHLANGIGTTVDELAVTLDIKRRPSEMLLTACAALGLLDKTGSRYHNSPLAEQFLVRGTPYFFGGFVQLQDHVLYDPWGRLVEALRTDRPTSYDPDTQRSFGDAAEPHVLASFMSAMHSLSMSTAAALSRVVDFSSFTRLLDVGGGSGAFDIELCQRYSHLRATVYDVPAVTAIAADYVCAARLSDRITVHAGDVFDDTLPDGHDVILLSHVLHSFNEAHNSNILRKCYQALPSNGTIIISELLVDDDKTGPAPAALMSLTMLIGAEPGARNYTGAEYSAWLTAAGFQHIEVRPVQAPGANGIVIARKP